MDMRKLCAAAMSAVLVILPGAALADETVTHSYDGLGRLVTSSYSGSGSNAGMANTITYDAAGNRTNYTVTGSRFAAAVVVVPLNGFTIIPLAAGSGQ